MPYVEKVKKVRWVLRASVETHALANEIRYVVGRPLGEIVQVALEQYAESLKITGASITNRRLEKIEQSTLRTKIDTPQAPQPTGPTRIGGLAASAPMPPKLGFGR